VIGGQVHGLVLAIQTNACCDVLSHGSNLLPHITTTMGFTAQQGQSQHHKVVGGEPGGVIDGHAGHRQDPARDLQGH
jgi:hypothetical protein